MLPRTGQDLIRSPICWRETLAYLYPVRKFASRDKWITFCIGGVIIRQWTMTLMLYYCKARAFQRTVTLSVCHKLVSMTSLLYHTTLTPLLPTRAQQYWYKETIISINMRLLCFSSNETPFLALKLCVVKRGWRGVKRKTNPGLESEWHKSGIKLIPASSIFFELYSFFQGPSYFGRFL